MQSKKHILRMNTTSSMHNETIKEKVLKFPMKSTQVKISKFANRKENNSSPNMHDITECRKLENKSKIEEPEVDKVVLHVKDLNESGGSSKKVCKICYEGDVPSENKKLITPCKCQGSVKYIHEECLKNWILNNPKLSVRNPTCELCGYKYDLTFETKFEINKVKRCRYLEKLTTVLIASLVILSSISYIIFLIISSATKMKDDTKFIFALSIFGGFLVIFFVILFFALRSYRKFVYEEVLVDWKIKSLE